MNGVSYDPVLLPRIVFWTMLGAVLTITTADPDLWGHVRFGLDIVRDRTLVTADPYSFTSDVPWVNHEWLAETLMAAAYAVASGGGLVALKVTLLAATLLTVGAEVRRRSGRPPLADILVAITAVGCLALLKTMRPQSFSILAYAGLLVCLSRAEDGKARALWVIPPLFAAWANLHGGWLVGAGVLGLWSSTGLLWPGRLSRARWMMAGLTGVAATLINPYGVSLWRFLATTVGIDRADISEWQPVLRLQPDVWIIWGGITALALLLLRRQARSWPRVLTAVVLAAMSFRVARLVPFYAVSVAVLLVPALHTRPHKAPPGATGLVAAAALAVFGLAALGVWVEAFRRNACVDSAQPWMADREAAAAMRNAGMSGRLVTTFDWGEFAIWHLGPALRVSIDGRRETVYSADRLAAHRALLDGTPAALTALATMSPDVVWVPTAAALAGQLAQAGWHRAFASRRSVVFTRQPIALTAPSVLPPPCFPN